MRSRDPSRRRRILQAARQHFTRYGFKGTNLDAVAADAGCAKGALYLEFADKESLLREVAAGVFSEIRARYDAEVRSIASPLARLRETLRFAFRQWATEPLFERLQREDPDLRALVPAEGPEALRAAARAQTDEIVAWIDEGIARGEIRPDVDREAVPHVLGVLRFSPQHLGMVTSLGLMPRDRVLDAIVDVFVAGLAPRAEEQGAPKKRRAR